MTRLPYLLHALSPVHAGTGQGADVIDLPIARLVSSGIPFVPGSSLKGVLRAEARAGGVLSPAEVDAVFGPDKDTGNPSAHAGAIVVGDARLLAMPVRCNRGAFALVTSPLLLTLAARDLGDAAPAEVPSIEGTSAMVGTEKHANVDGGRVFLVDNDLNVDLSAEVDAWAAWLASALAQRPDEQRLVQRRLVVVDDDTMAFLWDTATQIDARNSIDVTTGVVARGQLWWEESLPAESVLIGLIAAESSRKPGTPMNPSDVLAHAQPPGGVVQVGGKATIGRGLVRLTVLDGGGA